MGEVWYNQEHIYKYPQIYARDEIMGFHISSISRYQIYDFEHSINFSDTGNCLINENFFLSIP